MMTNLTIHIRTGKTLKKRNAKSACRDILHKIVSALTMLRIQYVKFETRGPFEIGSVTTPTQSDTLKSSLELISASEVAPFGYIHLS